jgi:Ni,Fe-hydrogenase III large subunit
MSRAELLTRCQQGLTADFSVDEQTLPPAWLVRIDPLDWAQAAAVAKEMQSRFAAFWVDRVTDEFVAYCCFELAHEYLLFSTRCSAETPLPSVTPLFPAADRPERHARDLLGIQFSAAPDSRRWVRHQAWQAQDYPLVNGSTIAPQEVTPPDSDYPFVRAHGAGVVEIPVGPVHAGIIEPGHFRFHAVGETVLNLEQHLGYVHKGIELLAKDRDAAGLARLAGRVSGDSTVAHTWAACQALERARHIDVPQRALWLRALLAERERVANHVGDIGSICNDVGFGFAQAQFTRLKELWLRENQQVWGHRLLMDRIIPGGVSSDVSEKLLSMMAASADRLADEFKTLIDCLEVSESLEDRLMTTGRLTKEQATMLGVVGYVGKASGLDFDIRRHAPYPPYDQLEVTVPTFHAGDVAGRSKVRAEEVIISLQLIKQIIENMPAGPVCSAAEFGGGAAAGLGIIEGWRGEIVTFVRLDTSGRVSRFFPRDPSWLLWPALELLIQDNIVPDFPVCNKSVNGSYSGQDL